MSNIESVVSEFVGKIEALVEARVKERVDSVMTQVFSRGKRSSGRPRKVLAAASGSGIAKRESRVLSPARRRAMKRQGIYLGLLKGLTDSDRARVKAVAGSEGVEAAIALGRQLKSNKSTKGEKSKK